jgi:hypothetical protein
MREGLRAKDTKIPEAELEAIMANADVNGDGKVDYEEFLAATMHLGKLEREEHLYRAFKVTTQVLPAGTAGPLLTGCQGQLCSCRSVESCLL